MVMNVFLKNCIILYHLDNYRNIKGENGIKFNDPELNIKWQTKKPIVSKEIKIVHHLKNLE